MRIKIDTPNVVDYSFEEFCEDNSISEELLKLPIARWTWYREYFIEYYGWMLDVIEKNGENFATVLSRNNEIIYESSLINKDIDKCREDLISQVLHIEKRLKSNI